MSQIRVTLEETRPAVAPRTLLRDVEAYCRELFPSDTRVTCNDTRVEASFLLGEDVHAHAIIDVDPVSGEDNTTRLTGSFVVSGAALRDRDEAAVQRLAAQVFEGLKEVVSRRLNNPPTRRFDFGLD